MMCFRFRHYKLGYDISIYYFKFHITLDLVDPMMNDGHGAKMSNVVLTRVQVSWASAKVRVIAWVHPGETW